MILLLGLSKCSLSHSIALFHRASSIQSQASELQDLEARLQAAERKKQEVSKS